MCVDGDWVTSLWISPQTCTGLFPLDVAQSSAVRHVALYHIELAQLWRCPVSWCTVWKGTAQDCVDHMRRTHDVPLAVKAANLARYFSPWTVTREQWSSMTHPSILGVVIDTLLLCRIGSSLRRLHAFLEEVSRQW